MPKTEPEHVYPPGLPPLPWVPQCPSGDIGRVYVGIAEEDVEDVPRMLTDDEGVDAAGEPIPIEEVVIPAFDGLVGLVLEIALEDDMDRGILDDVVLMLGLSPGLFPPIGVAVAVNVEVG